MTIEELRRARLAAKLEERGGMGDYAKARITVSYSLKNSSTIYSRSLQFYWRESLCSLLFVISMSRYKLSLDFHLFLPPFLHRTHVKEGR